MNKTAAVTSTDDTDGIMPSMMTADHLNVLLARCMEEPLPSESVAPEKMQVEKPAGYTSEDLKRLLERLLEPTPVTQQPGLVNPHQPVTKLVHPPADRELEDALHKLKTTAKLLHGVTFHVNREGKNVYHV